MASLLDFILHIDKHIGALIRQHGTTTYAILFAVVFAETGLVVTPFLPGDSLLFAVGVFCNPNKGPDSLNVGFMFAVFCLAALTGDNLNYFIGKCFGHKLFRNEKSRIFKKSNLEQTHEFFEKHGPKTVILARFIPIVRTFCPFVAGMGKMPYKSFICFSAIGAVVWVGLFLFAGYFFGQLKFVEKNFTVAIIVMVALTGLPMVWEFFKAHKEAKRKAAEKQLG